MKRILITLLLASSSLAAPAYGAECGCKDLPQLLRELNEQEWLQKLFASWGAYMPRELATPGDVRARAQTEFTAHFYGDQSGSAAGTAHGGHAHMGTDLSDASCPIVLYHYDRAGKPVLNRDGSHRTSPVDESKYRSKQCDAFVKYTFAHERYHQKVCLDLAAKGRSKLWDSPEFFARNDAEAYQAGIDVLRSEAEQLARKCGWDNSTKNRLPSLDEAQDLARKAARSRPARRRK